ncbi:MAG: hypothetical protein HOP19_23750, partial [Acidobacteria bacterium]|nr:hypothetical protein [Acidobacteriota bacterium]
VREELCQADVAAFVRQRREWMSQVKTDAPVFLTGTVGMQGKTPVWWASAGAQGLWRGSAEGARVVEAEPTAFVAVSPADAQTLYAVREGGRLARSTDGGASFAAATLPESECVLRLHHDDAAQLWAGGRRLWRSVEGGKQWMALPGKLEGTEANRITALMAQGNVVWIGTREGWVQRFDETGASFAALPRRGYVSAVALDPHAANILYAVYATFGAPHVWQSLDGGMTWRAIDNELPDIPVNAFAADPQAPGRLFVGTDIGVFVTDDNGAHWSRTLSGLLVTALRVAGGRLYAFGNSETGAGVWRTSLVASSVAPSTASSASCIWEYANQLIFKVEGETLTTNFAAMTNCDWTATLDAAAASWVTIVNGASGKGNGSITLTAARNPLSGPRTGSLTLNDVTIALLQEGTANDCSLTPITPGIALTGQLTASDCALLFHGARWVSDRYSFTGRAGELVFVHTMQATNNLGVSFLLRAADGSLVNLSAPPNNSFYVLPKDDTYVVQLYSAVAVQPLDYRVAVQLLSPGCDNFAVTGLDSHFASSGGAGRLMVSTAGNCAWQLAANVPWVTFPNLNGRGSQLVNFTVAENTTATPRTAKLFIGTQSIEIRQAGVGGDCEVRRLTAGNQRVTGTLTAGDCFQATPQTYPQDVYEFDGLTGQRVSAELLIARAQSCNCGNSEGLSLRNARGSSLAFSARQIGGLVLPEDGKYTLLVSGGELPPTMSLDYSLAFTLAPADCTLRVTPERQVIESAAATARVSIQTPRHCPWQYQQPPSAVTTTPASGTQGIGPTTLAIPIPANPELTNTRSFISTVSGQQFSIAQLGKNISCAVAPLTPGEPVTRQLSYAGCPSVLNSYPGVKPLLAGTSQRFSFYGEQGQVFTFTARPIDRSGIALPYFVAPAGYSLLDPQGVLVTAGQTEVSLSAPGIVLPKTGTYQFELAGGPLTSSDSYQLTVYLNATECAVMASVSATKFDAAGGGGRLFIETAAGCGWEVEYATGASQFLIDASRSGTGRGVVEFSFRPNPSTSAVLVTLRIGRQTLTLEQAGQNGSCRPAVLPFDQFVSGQILAGDCAVGKPPEGGYYTNREYGDVYTFQGNAGEQVALHAPRQFPFTSSPSIPHYVLLRPTVKLYAPDGQLLTDTLAARALESHYLLPQTGTYRVTVSPPTDNAGYISGVLRDYQIMLERLTPGCLYTTSNDLQRFDGGGGNGTYRVATASGCQWKPRANVAWLRPLTPASSATATGGVTGTFAVEANAEAITRVGSLVVGGRLIEVEQAGANGQCVIETLAPNSSRNGTLAASDCRARNNQYAADFYQFTTRLNDRIRLNVTSNTPNAQFSTMVFDSSWRPMTTSTYFSTGLWMALPADTYYLQVQGGSRESVTPYTVSLDVASGTCDFALTPVERRFTTAGGTGTINVSTQPGCVWAASSGSNTADMSWLAITEGGSGSGSGSGVIKYRVQPFDLIGGARTGWIQLLEHRVVIGQSSGAETCEPVPLTLGQPRTGVIESGDCPSWFAAQPETTRADRFTFTSPAHRQFAIELTSALPATLTLYDAQRRVLGQNGYGQARIPAAITPENFLVLPDNQTYGVEIASTEARATFNYTVKLVAPAACAVNLRQIEPAQNQPVAAAGGSGLLQVIAPNGCAWDVTRLPSYVPPWLTFTTATTGTGNGTVAFRWAANDTPSYRYVEFGPRALQQLVLGQLGVNGACVPRAITAGQTVRGTLRESDCRVSLRLPLEYASQRWEQDNPATHQFTFAATAGEQLALWQRYPNANSFGPLGRFTLFDPQGRIVGVPHTEYVPSKLTLPQTGTYTLEYAMTPGDYEFVLDVTAGGCGFLLESEDAQLAGTSGAGTANVTTQGDCRWTAYAQEPWITVTNGSGQGSGEIRFTVAANTSTQTRRGFIRLAGRTLAVTQAGQGGSCAPIPIAPGQILSGEIKDGDCVRAAANQCCTTAQPLDRYVFTARAGEHAQVKAISGGDLGVQILPVTTLRASSAASDVPVGLPQPRDWFGTASMTIPADGAYVIEVISGNANRLPLPYTVHLQLNAAGCGVVLSDNATQFGTAAATGSFNALAPAGCRWEVYAVNDWITVAGARERNGASQIAFTVAANTGNQARWGAIIAGGQVYLIEQAGTSEAPGTCTVASLTAGQTVFGHLSSADCRPRSTSAGLLVADRYRFTGAAGQRIYLLARFADPYLPHLSLFDSTGALLTEATGNSPSKPSHTRLPQGGDFVTLTSDGEYLVEIARRTEHNAPAVMNYSLNLMSVPAGCTFGVNAQPLRFAAAGGPGTVNVVTSSACSWTVRATESWITNASATNTTGSGTMSFTVAPNPANQSRRSFLLIGGHLVIVEQAGVAGSCTPQPLTPGQIANSTLDEADCSGYVRVSDQNNTLPRYVERYSFTAQAGDRMAFTVTRKPTSGSPFWLRLLSPSGTPLLTNSTGRLPTYNERFVLPVSGAYEIEISADDKIEYEYLLL